MQNELLTPQRNHVTGKCLAIVAFCGVCLVPLMSQDSKSPEKIECRQDIAACDLCHQVDAAIAREAGVENACSQYCGTCHKDKGTHHPIGMALPADKTDGLRLSLNHSVACISCHRINMDRFSDQSWKAESAFDHLFKKQAKYKTYFLAKRNNKGQLCMVCH